MDKIRNYLLTVIRIFLTSMRFITLTTDMGLDDHYVAAVKATILQQCDQPVHLIDITHNVQPFDVAEAAFHVSQAFRSFPEGTIHIVGVDSEPIFNFGNSEGAFPSIMVMNNQYFISNDNGFFGVLSRFGQDIQFYRIEDVLSNPKGFKFPTKNMLVPIAAKLANGEKIEEIATPHASFKKAFATVPVIEEHLIKGSIIHFDKFGNAITNIDTELFQKIGNNSPFIIKFREGESYKIDVISKTYNEVPEGEKLALFSENGLLEIAINRGANQSTGGAQKLFALRKNDIVRIEFMPRGSRESFDQLF